MAWGEQFRTPPPQGRGTRRQRRRRKQVAGPYRSQSSVPSIRRQATQREHRKVAVPPRSPAASLPANSPLRVGPRTERTSSGATVPSLVGLTSSQRAELARRGARAAALSQILKNIAQQREAPSTLEALEIASLGIPGVGLVSAGAKAARAGTLLADALRGSSKAIRASEEAARGVRAAARAARGAGQRAAAKTPRPVRAGARGVRRHPFLSAAAAPVVAEVPGGNLENALSGSGRLAAALGAIGSEAQRAVPGVAGNALRDLASLPAQVLPSIYLTGKAGVKAAQGDTREAKALLRAFLAESALPALVQGDLKEAGRRAAAHPLYTALEVAGPVAGAGRVAGAVKRRGRPPAERPSARVYGDIVIPQGRYSRNAITEALQRRRDRKLAERGFRATPRQAAKHLRGRLDRTVFASEQARRGAVRDAQEAMLAIREVAGKGNADAVALAVQRIARNPDTAMDDLAAYRDALVAQQAKLTGGRLRANQATVARIEKALAHDDPEALVEAANRFIAEQRPIQEGLHERGLYDPEQTERASAIGFMRFHEGAGYGKPEGPVRRAEAALQQRRQEIRDQTPQQLSGFRDAVDQAKARLRYAESGRTQAERDLAVARRGPDDVATPELPGLIAGFQESVNVARQRLEYAQSGYVQAERTLATRRSRLKADLARAKSDKARAKVRGALAQAERERDAARQRVAVARQEIRETEAARDAEAAAIKSEARQAEHAAQRERAERTAAAARERHGAARQELRETATAYNQRRRELRAQARKDLSELGALLQRAKREPAQMLDRDGNPLPTEAIREALARQGAEAPGFISNRPGTMGRGAYYRPSTERPSGIGQRTTGKAVMEGTSDTSFDAIERQFIGGASRLQQAKNFDHVTAEYGLVKPDGSYFRNTEEAKRAIESPDDFDIALPDIPGGWTTRRAVPWPTRKAELDAQKEHARPAEADSPEANLSTEDSFMEDVIRRSQEDGDGPVVLFPKILADRERHHFSAKMPFEKTAQAATGLFKGARLPTSPAWLAGNVADIWGIRTLISGITPGDIRTGKRLERIMKEELTPDQQVRAMESLVPGGVFGHVRRVQPYRAAEQFVGTSLEPLWRAMTTLRHAPGAEQVGNLYARYRDAVFHLEGKFIERTPQYGALSRAARRDLGMTRRQFRKAVRDMEPAVRDLARGFRHQDNVDRFAKSIEDIYGNWGKNGPEARRFLTTWAPFWMWLRAATKFAWFILPRDHPVLTSIIAAAETMTREERQKLGLDLWGEEPVPDFLQGGVPVPEGVPYAGGKVLKTGNLTTFGMFNNWFEGTVSMVAPNWASGLLAAMGLDWKGDLLVDSEGRPADQLETAKVAALTTGEVYVPFITTIKSILDRGAEGALPTRAYDPDTVDYLRSLSESRQINVPLDGERSADIDGSGIDPAELFSRPDSNGIDPAQLFAR